MAWDSTFPITATTDWTTATFLQQFVRAMRERQGALQQTVEVQSQDGAEITFAPDPMDATHYNIGRLQQWIMDNCQNFVDSTNYGSSFETQSWLIHYTTATFLAAAGLNAGGFTRRCDDGTVAYGVAQDGDCVTVDIFNELYRAFNVLLWTSPSVVWADGAARGGWTELDYSQNVAGAETQTTTQYNATSGTPAVGVAPCAWSYINCLWGYVPNPGWYASAELARIQQKISSGQMSGPTTGAKVTLTLPVNVQVDYYISMADVQTSSNIQMGIDFQLNHPDWNGDTFVSGGTTGMHKIYNKSFSSGTGQIETDVCFPPSIATPPNYPPIGTPPFADSQGWTFLTHSHPQPSVVAKWTFQYQQ